VTSKDHVFIAHVPVPTQKDVREHCQVNENLFEFDFRLNVLY